MREKKKKGIAPNKVLNKTTIKTLKDSEAGKNLHRVSSIEELFEKLKL
jgi:antitoxin component of RelBE/YafQ-DinJ toxin-antitoxin module